jgi:hypothetical protein
VLGGEYPYFGKKHSAGTALFFNGALGVFSIHEFLIDQPGYSNCPLVRKAEKNQRKLIEKIKGSFADAFSP